MVNHAKLLLRGIKELHLSKLKLLLVLSPSTFVPSTTAAYHQAAGYLVTYNCYWKK